MVSDEVVSEVLSSKEDRPTIRRHRDDPVEDMAMDLNTYYYNASSRQVSDPSIPSSQSIPVSPSTPSNHQSSLVPLTIGLWNANGLQASTVDDLLRHCQSFSLVFITETWLLPPARLPTSWQQFHLYGSPVAGQYRGSMGVSALVSPRCSLPVVEFPVNCKYALGLQLGRSLRLICLYLPPSLPTAEVQSVLDSLPLTDDTIICGDLNVRLGRLVGDSRTNMRSSVLRRWCDDHGLNILNKTLAYGIPTYLTCRGHAEVSSIVDYYITNMPLVRSASISVALDLSLGSDHKLMSLSFEYSVPVVPSTQSSPSLGQVRRLWNLSRLKEPEVQQLYVSTFCSLSAALLDQLQQLCSSPPSTRPPIDHLNDELNAAIYSALDKSVGSRTSRPKQWKRFWTSQLQALADRRDWLYRKWRWSLGIDKAYGS
ncbi:hypothetical protein G6F55_012690 [Rhizopus delemar]|nr:hypothetical protein G6F55_012690 [Rhizopus delemar]